MCGKEIRDLRIQAGLRGWQVCRITKVGRSRLCGIELGYVEAPEEELTRIAAAIERLRTAKAQVWKVAEELDLPL